MRQVKIEVELYCDDAENPHEFDGTWTLRTWNSGSISDVNREDLVRNDKQGAIIPANVGLANKFRAGTAFWVRESGDDYRITDDPSRASGVLSWEHPIGDMGAESVEDRRKDAEADLAAYSAWAFGRVYGYEVKCAEVGFEDTCSGYYGDEDLFDAVTDVLAGLLKEWDLTLFSEAWIDFSGDATWLADYDAWPDRVRNKGGKVGEGLRYTA